MKKIYYVRANNQAEAYKKVSRSLKRDDTEYSLTHEGNNYTIKNKAGRPVAVSTDRDKAMSNLDNLNQGKPMTDEGEYKLVRKDGAYLIKKGSKIIAEYETKAEALRNLKALNMGRKRLDDSLNLNAIIRNVSDFADMCGWGELMNRSDYTAIAKELQANGLDDCDNGKGNDIFYRYVDRVVKKRGAW